MVPWHIRRVRLQSANDANIGGQSVMYHYAPDRAIRSLDMYASNAPSSNNSTLSNSLGSNCLPMAILWDLMGAVKGFVKALWSRLLVELQLLF